MCPVEPEKSVELVAVAGDSLVDSSELERVRFVMQAGQVIRNDLVSPGGATGTLAKSN